MNEDHFEYHTLRTMIVAEILDGGTKRRGGRAWRIDGGVLQEHFEHRWKFDPDRGTVTDPRSRFRIVVEGPGVGLYLQTIDRFFETPELSP